MSNKSTAAKVNLADIEGLPTLVLWSDTEPSAAGVLNVGRSVIYDMAKRGEIPVIRAGASIRVPVPALLKMLGASV